MQPPGLQVRPEATRADAGSMFDEMDGIIILSGTLYNSSVSRLHGTYTVNSVYIFSCIALTVHTRV